MTTLNDALSESIIALLSTQELFVSLHTADPGKTGADEASGLPRIGVNVDERQTVTITGTPDGGTFTLTFDSQTTSGIAYNASAGDVESALEALSSIEEGEVSVSGGPGPGTPYVVRFTEGLGKQDVDLLVADGGNLSGGSSPDVEVTETQKGAAGFGAASAHIATGGRRVANTAVIDFGEAGETEEYTHGGVWSAVTSGTFHGGNALVAPVSATTGNPVVIPVGDFGIVGAGIS